MGLLRVGPPCARAMARLGAVRSHYCALLLAAALAVCAFYYLGSGRETFSSATKRLKEARAGAPAAPSPPVLELARGSLAPAPGAKAKSLEGGGAGPVDYHLLMMFTKAEHNAALQAKARVALRSLLRLAKFEAHEVLNLHFVSEEASREVAKALLRELLPPAAGFKCKCLTFEDGAGHLKVQRLLDKEFPQNRGQSVPSPPQHSVPAFCHSIQSMPCPEKMNPSGTPTSHSEAPGLDSMVQEAKNPGPGSTV
nr:PREDICTED: xyloside xylosyltransferase 1 [Bos mutus]